MVPSSLFFHENWQMCSLKLSLQLIIAKQDKQLPALCALKKKKKKTRHFWCPMEFVCACGGGRIQHKPANKNSSSLCMTIRMWKFHIAIHLCQLNKVQMREMLPACSWSLNNGARLAYPKFSIKVKPDISFPLLVQLSVPSDCVPMLTKALLSK